jgi:polar amino acid transport system ATP-binding protein
MLVTHDMNLARRVSNRVLYMDEGGVYEDGSPEVIFENPAREKTRRFVRKLKTLDFRIDSQEFDFIGCNTEMKEFGLKNDIPKGIVLSVMLIFEGIYSQILLPHFSVFKMRWVVEYSKENETTTITADYSEEPFDITKPGSAEEDVSGPDRAKELSMHLIRGLVRDIQWSYTDAAELGNHLSMTVTSAMEVKPGK